MDQSTKNTADNVPSEWYREEEHVGYNLYGKKLRKEVPTDSIENFLTSIDVRDSWRKILDDLNGYRVAISRETLEIVKKICRGVIPEHSISNPDFSNIRASIKNIEEISTQQEPKRRFLPSRWETKVVLDLTRKFRSSRQNLRQIEKNRDTDIENLLWSRRSSKFVSSQKLQAPKVKVPGHDESYNPLIEYLKNNFGDNVEDFQHLRNIPTYPNFFMERFHRCLDLYLCPRFIKQSARILPEDMLPSFYESKFLNFPSKKTLHYTGHLEYVQHIALHATGHFLATSDKNSVLIWEVSTGRVVKTLKMTEIVSGLAWRPLNSKYTISVCAGTTSVIFSSIVSTPECQSMILKNSLAQQEQIFVWSKEENTTKIEQKSDIQSLVWHQRGEYFATVAGNDLVIHRASNCSSQNFFVKQKHKIIQILFDKIKPSLYLATPNDIRIYDLREQTLIKKLVWGSGQISCIALHPLGNHLIAGSQNAKVAWFDIDFSSSPVKTISSHSSGIKTVIFHEIFSVFATVSSNEIHLFQGQVNNHLAPSLTPLKIIKSELLCDSIKCAFHPFQPWLFVSSRENKSIDLYCEALLE
jgi:ribosome biogenesis protein ERB1